jgi:hypothetical protein
MLILLLQQIDQERKGDPNCVSTYAAIKDDLYRNLKFRMEIVIIKDRRNKNGKIRVETLGNKYLRQAIAIITHHAQSGQVKDFVIKESDLRKDLRGELSIDNIGGNPKQYHKIIKEIFSDSVRRLFEELDIVYYHEHLADRLGVKFIP